MIWYTKWKAKREFKKVLYLIEKLCDEGPSSFFTNLIFDANGNPLPSIEARNTIMANVERMRRLL